MENQETYSYPLAMTQQFRFCGNPFRVDMYKGCNFGCKYCFANSSIAAGHGGWAVAKLTAIERLFNKAFDNDEETKNLTIELLRHRVPLHCGGMSDPFQPREWELGLTKGLIEISNKYNYPISFSTKTASLPEEYFKVLNPELHAFQVSIMGWDDDFIKKYETNTPTAKERLAFVKKLRDKGFWCSIRIQPCVDIDQALKLVTEAGDIPSYITVEHLKIPRDNIKVKELFKEEYTSIDYYYSNSNFRNIEMYPEVKKKNIEKIKEVANKNGVLIGVGDNDLHHLSQSRCCCGVDLMPEAFSNWLKYNLTYMVTGEYNEDEIFIPQCIFKESFTSESTTRYKTKEQRKFKFRVDDYLQRHPELIQPSDYSDNLKKTLKTVQETLF